VWPHNTASRFDLLRNSGHYWTVFARNRNTAVPEEGNGDLQTLICVFAARLRWCPTLSLSNPVLWQNWMAAYPGCTLSRRCFLADQLWFITHIWEEEDIVVAASAARVIVIIVMLINGNTTIYKIPLPLHGWSHYQGCRHL